MRIWRKSNQKSVKYPESESVSVKGPISLVAAVPLEKVERKFIDFRLCLLRRESEWRFIAWLGWNFQKKGNERCCEERSEEEVSVCKIQTPTMGNISAGLENTDRNTNTRDSENIWRQFDICFWFVTYLNNVLIHQNPQAEKYIHSCLQDMVEKQFVIQDSGANINVGWISWSASD